MPAPPGSDAPDVPEGGESGGSGARVKAPRADAGPKRTPRPTRASASGSGGNGSGRSRSRRSTEVSGDEELVLEWTTLHPADAAREGGALATAAPVASSVDTDPTMVATDTRPVPVVAESAAPDPVAPVEVATAAPTRAERRAARAEARTPAPRRGRRVRRVVRRIELWSVLKLATVLYTCLYVAVLATLALLWGAAYSSGQMDRLQSFLADVGMENYRFYGDQMFRAAAAIGAVGVLAATLITVLTAALVNVISEMTGGIRLVVIEEDPPPRRP